MIIDLRTGDTVEWIKLDGEITELFDVAVMPDTICPMAVGIDAPEMRSIITFDSNFGPLNPPVP
ncbi:hypothetical protein D3C87_1191250 [compost metagenome]